MRTIARASFTTGLFALAIHGSAGALASLPSAIDRVPADAIMVGGASDIGGFFDRAKAMMDSIGAGDAADNPLRQVAGFIDAPGMNRNGSAAIAVIPGQDGELNWIDDDASTLLIIPVTDFGAFVGSFGADPVADGPTMVRMMGEIVYTRDLGGGFIAMAPEAWIVDRATEGQLRVHRDAMGSNTARLAETSDVFFTVSIEKVGPQIEGGLAEFRAGMDDFAAMFGEEQPAMREMLGVVQTVASSLVRDGRTAAYGMTIGSHGISMDFAADFDEGSPTASYMVGSGGAIDLMGALPDTQIILAMAMDTSSPKIKEIFGKMTELASAMNPGQGLGPSMGDMMEHSDGFAFAMGNTPSLLMGGMFTNMVQYQRSSNPAKLLEAGKRYTLEMDGMEAEGITYRTQFREGAAEIDGVRLDEWGMQMQFDPAEPGAQQAGMAMMMVFGAAGGPSGYYAATDKGVITTFSRNTSLVRQVLEAERSTDIGLHRNAQIRAAHERLPSNPDFVLHLSLGPVLQQVGGLMAMAGAGAPQMNVPADLAPISMGARMGDNGMHGRLYVPSDVIKLVGDLSQQFAPPAAAPRQRDEDFRPRFE